MNNNELRMKYAGVIELLCECSVQVDEENREMIEQAVQDWCNFSGWSMRRTLNRIEVWPPDATGD